MIKQIIVGSVVALILLTAGAIELHKFTVNAEIEGCKAVIIRRLIQSGNGEVIKAVDFATTINSYCTAVIKNK